MPPTIEERAASFRKGYQQDGIPVPEGATRIFIHWQGQEVSREMLQSSRSQARRAIYRRLMRRPEPRLPAHIAPYHTPSCGGGREFMRSSLSVGDVFTLNRRSWKVTEDRFIPGSIYSLDEYLFVAHPLEDA